MFQFNIWVAYLLFYGIVSLAYLAFRNLLWMKNDFTKNAWENAENSDTFFSVVIPFYNESVNNLRLSVQSVLDADGNKEVVVVDDGSFSTDCYQMVKKEFKNVKVFRYSPNKGKREAQKVGFDNSSATILVTMDSDTIVEKSAFVELIKPFVDESVGATTGNLKVSNKKANWLTRMISASYWYANEGQRYSLSVAGVVTCCSGVLSAYRRTIINGVMNEYMNQLFLGKKCHYGDDRNLTNLVLKNGYKTIFVRSSVCHTEAPASFNKFLSQQLRWKKSFFREAPITISFAWKRSKILFFEMAFEILIPILILPSRIFMVAAVFFAPAMVPIFFLSIILFCLLRNIQMYMEEKSLVPYALSYAFVNEFVLYWLFFIAPIEVFRGNNKWGTR